MAVAEVVAEVVVEVAAVVTEPEKRTSVVCNRFNFTYEFGEGTPLRRVLPSNLEEAFRVAEREQADQQQEAESRGF